MGQSKNRQTAVTVIETLPKGTAAIRPFMADGFVWWTPRLGEIQGRMEQIFSAVEKHLQGPLTMTVTGVTADGDRVAVEAYSHAELTNGRTYHNLYHFLMEFKDEKIIAVREYNDSKHAFETWNGLMS